MEAKDKIQRSVDSLEMLYAVVIAFAVTRAIESVLFDPASNTVDLSRLIVHLPSSIAFLITIVPFYHGMHRHLSKTYIEETASSKKDGYLLLDFFVFFLEGCILLVFASSLDTGTQAFIVLSALFIVDLIWSIMAHGIHYSEFKNSPWRWAAINFVTIVVLFLIIFSNIFSDGQIKLWALSVTAVCRTVADYFFCWKFYFPREKTRTT
jgi:hypothetical protein